MWLLFSYNKFLHLQVIVLEEIHCIHTCCAQVLLPLLETDGSVLNTCTHTFLYVYVPCLKWVQLTCNRNVSEVLHHKKTPTYKQKEL